jgi:hypothetical protein
MKKLLTRLAPAAFALASLAAPLSATAGVVEDAYLGDMEVAPLTMADLEDQRGGFMTPLGFEVDFGAVVTSTVDGALAMKTEFNWTDSGVTKTVTTPDGALGLDAGLAGGINFGKNVADLTGVVVPGDPTKGGGATAIVQGFDLSGLSTAIINTASNREVITDTQLNLAVPALQLDNMAVQQAMSQMNAALSQALAMGGL